jgi:WD40 repeat protein
VVTAGRVELQVWDVAGGRLLFSHHEEVNRPGRPTATLSADGTRVALQVSRYTSSGLPAQRSELVVWDIATGLPLLRTPPVPTRGSIASAFRPDGTRLAVIVPENSVRRVSAAREWDLARGQERDLVPLTADTHVWGLAYSPDGRRVAIARYAYTRQEGTIEVRDAATDSVLWTVTDTGRGTRDRSIFTWSLDGLRLAFASTDEPVLRIYDATHGQLLQDLHGHATGVIACAFRADSTGLVSIGGDGVMKTWDIAASDIAPSTTTPIDRDVQFPALSAGGDRYALIRSASPADPWTVVVRETLGGTEVARITIPRTGTQRGLVTLSRRAKAVAIAESSPGSQFTSNEPRLTVADVATGEVRFQLGQADLGRSLYSLDFAPDGKTLALLADSSSSGNAVAGSEVQVRDARDGRVLARWGVKNPRRGLLLAYRGDSRALAVTDSETRDGEVRGLIRLFDPASGRVLRTLEANAMGFDALRFAPDGTYLLARYNSVDASGTNFPDLAVWNLALPGAAPQWVAPCGSGSGIAAFSADGRRLVVASTDSADQCRIRVLDTTSGLELLSRARPGGHPDGVAFTPDGRRLHVTLHGADSTGRLATWESGPLAVGVEAALLVDRLAVDLYTRDEVRAAVTAEPGLPADLRAEALKVADDWPQDGSRLMVKSITIAQQSARPGADYARALRYAEAVLAMAPEDAQARYCRGLARLRVGQLATARDDLAESVRTDQYSLASAWAALALTEARLGRQAEAFEALGRMTRLFATTFAGRVPPDIKREAEALILDPIFPDDPFAP